MPATTTHLRPDRTATPDSPPPSLRTRPSALPEPALPEPALPEPAPSEAAAPAPARRCAACGLRLQRCRRAATVGAVVGAVLLGTPGAARADDGISHLRVVAQRLTTEVTAIAASVAVLFLVLAGVRYVISGGNPQQRGEARQAALSALGGLAVTLLAGVVVNLVVSALR